MSDTSVASQDTAVEDSVEPDALTGEELYITHCSGCHGIDGNGGPDAPDVQHHLSDTAEELVDIIINGIGRMDPVSVTEEEAYLIVEYMKEVL